MRALSRRPVLAFAMTATSVRGAAHQPRSSIGSSVGKLRVTGTRTRLSPKAGAQPSVRRVAARSSTDQGSSGGRLGLPSCQWGGADGGCQICQLQCGEFSSQIYHYVATIPRGSVATYSSVCEALGRPRASRAVGNAMKVNVLNKPDAKPRVPCHRVVRSDGSMAGFSGGGCVVKMDLLKSEGVPFDDCGKIPAHALSHCHKKA